jgi:hypothetical protein
MVPQLDALAMMSVIPSRSSCDDAGCVNIGLSNLARHHDGTVPFIMELFITFYSTPLASTALRLSF